MAFLSKQDFDSRIYAEILDAITRNDDTIVDVMIDVAISEMKGYLSARYDTDAIFSQSGSNRHPVILEFAKDIALYHLHSIHDPAKIPEIRVDRYKRAIEWLKEVNAGHINPDLPLSQDQKKDYVAFGSNPKRQNHY